ncbi:MAG: TonB-dependent receptor [Myxococcales bacterium]|nr:TonB-dependent receptor [Myxococcales bacterium]
MVCWIPLAAWATPPPDADEEVVVEGSVDPADPVRASAQVTVVPVDDSFAGSADVASAVARAPGARIQRLGGMGDLAQVGIRGASSRTVEITLHGTPLNPEGAVAVNLSELPLAGLSRVEVTRTGGPSASGTAPMGGSVNLVTSADPTHRVSLSAGSWGTLRAQANASGSAGAWSAWVAASTLATEGTFRWYDDGGTRLWADDDTIRVRRNNQTHQASTLTRLAWRAGPQGELSALHAGLWRAEGVPGFTFDPSATARFGVQRQLLALTATATPRASRLEATVSGLDRTEALSDPLGELGVAASDVQGRTRAWTGRLTARTLPLPGLLLAGLVGGQLDRYASTDRLLDLQAVRGRWVGRGAAWARVGDPQGAVHVEPAVTVLAVATQDLDTDTALRRAPLVLPRLGLRAGLRGDWVLKANAGASARPPDVLELFGARGTQVGNPELVPERSWTADGGLLKQASAWRLEAVLFARSVRDLIAWSRSAQGISRAENVDRATVAGLEAAASWERGPLQLRANAAVIRARDASDDPAYRGRQLPTIPVAEAQLLGALRAERWQLLTDGSLTSGTFVDRANLVPQPPRALWGATARWLGPGLQLELDVRNLLDHIVATVPRDPLVDDGQSAPAAVTDFLGYPLPGRTVLFTVRMTP